MSLLFPKPTFFSTSREKVELWNRANIEVAAQCWCKPNNLILQAANYLFQLSMDTKWGGQAVNKATMLITLGTWYYLLTCLTIFSLSQIPITHRPISPLILPSFILSALYNWIQIWFWKYSHSQNSVHIIRPISITIKNSSQHHSVN